MAQNIKRFVDVYISKSMALVTSAGFGVPLMLTTDVSVITTTERVREYLSLAAVELDFADTTDEYKGAKAFFNQDFNNKNFPERLLIGCWDKVGVEAIADALTAIRAVNDDWYVLGTTAAIRTDVTELEALADEIEGLAKVMILDSNNTLDTDLADDTALLAILKAKDTDGYKRTMIVHHDDATLYPSWSIMGKFLPLEPGSSQIAYHKLADTTYGATYIDPANITEVQKDNLFERNGNSVVSSIGAEFFYPGIMVGGKNLDREGEYFDIIRSIDFLNARCTEQLLSLLLEKANVGQKIPFTDGGISTVETRLSDALEKFGVDKQILVDGTIEISVPKREDVSTEDRDDRILPDLDFSAELAGAISTVVVRGRVRV
ncbi:MAG: DUF3383 family protein [Campylobacterota bacterium]|nr:DUF3383 family protein [Campylobacterota bacterium]